MSNQPWTDGENDLIVADYFAMLADDIAQLRPNKREHNRRLQARIGRSKGSIEYKHRNISAVLMGLGETWLSGYKPAFNFQMTLVEAVVRWLDAQPGWLDRLLPTRPHTLELQDSTAALSSEPAPSLRNLREPPSPQELKQMLEISRRFDVPGRDERNRALGRAGEERALAHERSRLADHGLHDLAREVRWVSEEDGDGAGYDIASFALNGEPRLIEVKTTNGWERTPFHITRNELAVADERRAEWRLLRLWNFSREPKAFCLRPPLEAHVALTPTTFQASFGASG